MDCKARAKTQIRSSLSQSFILRTFDPIPEEELGILDAEDRANRQQLQALGRTHFFANGLLCQQAEGPLFEGATLPNEVRNTDANSWQGMWFSFFIFLLLFGPRRSPEERFSGRVRCRGREACAFGAVVPCARGVRE